jgi:hypothetical protein
MNKFFAAIAIVGALASTVSSAHAACKSALGLCGLTEAYAKTKREAAWNRHVQCFTYNTGGRGGGQVPTSVAQRAFEHCKRYSGL